MNLIMNFCIKAKENCIFNNVIQGNAYCNISQHHMKGKKVDIEKALQNILLNFKVVRFTTKTFDSKV